MKRKSIKTVVSILLFTVTSCGEPETIVTNIVHPDGSVTRNLEMRSEGSEIEISDIQVPFDSTWIVRDSIEIDEDGDTTWVKRAEKFFANVDEINRDYMADSSANRVTKRRTEFTKKFKWFNTEYRFAEIIENTMSNGYPVSDFLNEEELDWFYSPENVTIDKLSGPDSSKYIALSDTVDVKTDRWIYKSLVSEWIAKFKELASGKPELDETVEKLKEKEEMVARMIIENNEKFDSLWSNGIILTELIGEENAQRFQEEADSAADIAGDCVLIDFVPYTLSIIMPGETIGTNGFIDSTKVLLWPTNSSFFLTEPYVMYAESKTPNKWAWVFSGIFLLFVLAGIIFRVIKK
jgi:hypothetical protein